jgi:hypothetical protein
MFVYGLEMHSSSKSAGQIARGLNRYIGIRSIEHCLNVGHIGSASIKTPSRKEIA